MLIVTPSKLLLLTGGALLATCVFIATLVGILHWKEKVRNLTIYLIFVTVTAGKASILYPGYTVLKRYCFNFAERGSTGETRSCS